MGKNDKNWGFDTHTMDKKIRPQDDFFHYANGGWKKRTTIPHTESRWGSFTKLRHDTDKKLRMILKEVTTAKKLKEGGEEQMVRDLYLSAINMKRRNALRHKPLSKILGKIDAIQDKKELAALLGEFEKIGFGGPWALLIDQDSKNSQKYVLHFYQSGLGMPDKEYYLKDEPEFKRVRNAYKTYIEKILTLSGTPSKKVGGTVKSILTIETSLAKISMDKEDSRDAEKIYHKKTIPELSRLAPSVDWNIYFKAAHIPKIPYVIVSQPEFLKGVGTLFSSVPIDEWKVYLTYHTLSGSAPLLSSTYAKAYFDFYGKTLSGSKKMRPLWRRALGAVNGGLGEALGKIYIKRYFKPEAKRKMDALVDDLFGAYANRIKVSDWMSSATKKKALDKLRLMGRKIGYPERWKGYKGLSIRRDDYFGNILRIAEFEHRRTLRKLKKKIDRHEWHMSPQTVNAYCNFSMNEIVFPAAILQTPFFNFEADDAVNYGAIGSVIGHEMTHGFDDQGSKFDGRGNMKGWWTKRDRERFEQKAKLLIGQYNGYTVADGVKVNGQLTLGENIADLGGIVIAYDAYQAHLKKTGRKNIGGFSPEERFFLGAAQAEREMYRDEYIKTAVLTDPHSPSEFRINGPLPNTDEFHRIYNVTKKDRLYREPSKRARIW